MPIPVSTGGKGANGIANVTVTTNKVRVEFEDNNNQVIEVLRDDAPDYIITGRQIVVLSSDNNKIFSAKPIGGSYMCKFIGFWSREGEPPTPKKVEARTGTSSKGNAYKIPEHLEFTVLFEIVTPKKWSKYQLSMNLFYAFSEYEGGITQIKGAGSQKLVEFLEVAGVDFTTDDIPFSENVLPFIEKMLLNRNKTMVISLNQKGWVDSVVVAPDDEEEELPEPEEKKPAVTVEDLVKAAKSAEGQDKESINALLKQLGFDSEE